MNDHWKSVIAIAIGGMIVANAIADATWKAALDGAWETPGNWSSDALPLATERALITPSDNAYTVTVSTAQTVQGLTLSGQSDRSYRTRLEIDGPLTIDGAELTARYCDIVVGESGSLEIRNSLSQNSLLGTGSRLMVDGGTFAMTNAVAKPLDIGEKAWLSGGSPSFVVNAGRAVFRGPSLMLVASASGYSRTELNGGTLEFVDSSASANAMMCYLDLNSDTGEAFKIDGNAELLFSHGGSMTFGRGVHTFSGNAKMRMVSVSDNNILVFGPYSSDNNRTSTVNISGDASIEAGELREFLFGKSDLRTTGTKGFLNLSGGLVELGYRVQLGGGIGEYEMNQTGGRFVARQYGVRIGGVPYTLYNTSQSNAKDLCCTSTVKVAGGIFECRAEQSHNNTPNKSMWGLVVGAGLVGTTTPHLMNGWTDGRLVIADGGTVSNGACAKIVGVGKAIGTILQTGGRFTGDGATEWFNEARDALVIGAFGGTGIYDMQGGTAELDCPLYVGGTTLALLQRTDGNGELPSDIDGKAVGTLRISGGTMSVTRDAVVGLDGMGTIELAGNGMLTIGRDLTLTNVVEGCAPTLKFTLSGETVPTLKVGGSLNVDEGAKLVVDAGDFAGPHGKFLLVDCASADWKFAEADVTFVGSPDLSIRRRADGNLYLVRRRGSRIIVR